MLTEEKLGVPQVSRFSRPGTPPSRQAWDFIRRADEQLGSPTVGSGAV
jgi:hypothetical protein